MNGNKRVWVLLIVLLLFSCVSIAQQKEIISADTVHHTSNISQSPLPDEKFDLFLRVLLLAGMGLMFGVLILVVAIGVIILLCAAALVATGILSISVAVALYKKSLASGLRTSFYLIFILMGGIAGAAAAWASNSLFELSLSGTTALLTGSIAGCIGGWMAAMVLFWMSKLVIQKSHSLKRNN